MLAILMTCDSPAKSFYYGVNLINQGDEQIVVEPFPVYDGVNATVDVGILDPGIEKGVSPFLLAPQPTHTIRWKHTQSGKKGETTVKIALPKEFTKKQGRFLNFYVNPKEQRVRVTFKVMDIKTGDLREIQ